MSSAAHDSRFTAVGPAPHSDPVPAGGWPSGGGSFGPEDPYIGPIYPNFLGADEIVEIAEDDLDHHKLDHEIEEIAGEGCMNVNKLLYAVDRDEVPERLETFSKAERDYICAELKSIMEVYDGGDCSL